MNLSKAITILFLSFLVVLFSIKGNTGQTKKNNVVNILTWWGYLNDKSLISKIEKVCDAKISYDEYYSVAEFLRRWSADKSKYQILIYTNTSDGVVLPEVSKIKVDIQDIADGYQTDFKKMLISRNYPKNTIYFMHSIIGFLWNKNQITLSENDTLDSIIEKSREKIVVFVDDPVEIFSLSNKTYLDGATTQTKTSTKDMGKTPSSGSIDYHRLDLLKTKSKLIITNDYEQILDKQNFAFAYIWSGEARNHQHHNTNLQFLAHPELSHASSDMLALTSTSPIANCVARRLGSKDSLRSIQKRYKYLTSFPMDTADKGLEELQPQLSNIFKVKWLRAPSQFDLNKMNTEWLKFKVGIQ